MPRIAWDKIGERFYEVGLDRGVLYVGTSAGIPWNGLVAISETPSGGEPKEYFQDGQKYLSLVSAEEFGATIEALTYPEAFSICDGTLLVANGLYAGQQSRVPFSLSYRTRIANDVLAERYAYKIHLVYNALAAPSTKIRNTLSDDTEASPLTWELTTTPAVVSGLKATSHFEIDSRTTPPVLLTTLENILYGSSSTAPRIPDAQELVDLFKNYVGPIPQPENPTPTPGTDTILDGGRVGAAYLSTYDGAKPDTAVLTTIDGGVP